MPDAALSCGAWGAGRAQQYTLALARVYIHVNFHGQGDNGAGFHVGGVAGAAAEPLFAIEQQLIVELLKLDVVLAVVAGVHAHAQAQGQGAALQGGLQLGLLWRSEVSGLAHKQNVLPTEAGFVHKVEPVLHLRVGLVLAL